MRFLLVPLLAATVAAGGSAQGRRFDFDTMGQLVQIRHVAFSPDGRRILAVILRPSYEDDRWAPELVRVDPETGAVRVLSDHRSFIAGPAWSPSGDRIAFISAGPTDSPAPQIWILPAAGGDARPVTRDPGGVLQFAWHPTGHSLAYAAEDRPEPRTGPERHNDGFEIGDDAYLIRSAAMPVHLWLVADTGGAARRISSGPWSLAKADATSPMSVSPDGTQIAVASQEDAHTGSFGKARIRVVDVATGAARVVGAGFGENPAFAPDGRSVLASRNRGPAPFFSSHGLVRIDLATGAERWVTERLDLNFYAGTWLPDGRVLVSTEQGTSTGAWIIDQTGTPTPIDLGGLQPAGISRSEAGAIAFAGTTPTTPPEIYFAPAGGTPRRLTRFNPDLADRTLGRSEGIEWTVEPGVTADGVLTYPPGYEAGRRYPLVLWFHGGPMGASTVAFLDRIQLMAARGWLVLQPNYRGSVNRGNRWQSAIIGDAGDGPGRDAMAGITSLIRRGIVDTSRMAISGWSYGGYLTAWMMGHYRGWKAAVAGAAITDFADSYALSDISVTYGTGWGGPLWDDRHEALARAQSPISAYRTMTTPTLILSDVGDERVPITESFKLYHALKDRGVPVQFIGYPVGGHVPTDPVRWRDVLRRAIDWIAKYFDGQP